MLNFFKNKKSAKEETYIDDIVHGIRKSVNYIYSPNDLSGVTEYEELKKKSKKEIKQIILDILDYIERLVVKGYVKVGAKKDHDLYRYQLIVSALLGGLMRRNLDYNEEEWKELYSSVYKLFQHKSKNKNRFSFSDFPVNYSIQQIERYVKKQGLSDSLSDYVKQMLDWDIFKVTQKSYWGSDIKKSRTKLVNLIQSEDEVVPFKLNTEDLGDKVNQVIENIHENKEEFYQIFHLTATATAGKPTKKYKDKVEEHIKAIGKDSYRKIAQELLAIPLTLTIETSEQQYSYNDGTTYTYTTSTYLCEPSKQFIKGIVWTMSPFSDKETIRVLGKLLEKSYTKMPGIGPAAATIGNACIYVLGNMRGKDGLGALSRAKLKLKQNNVKKSIDKYLIEGAKKYNVSVEELKEMSVPDFNLEKGTKIISFEDYTLDISIEDSKVVQQWIKPDGSAMKSVPSVVKNSVKLTNKLKETRKEVKEIQKVYSAQKQRIDNQLILDRTWDYPSFEKYYLNHGLVYPITSKLIWTFKNKEGEISDAILIDNKWQNEKEEEIKWIDKNCEVKLWHPVFASEEQIINWRDKIIDLELKQPLKQAFREIYILTDAEINTKSYSNRMAAHILKQHQFNALAGLRGWKYSLMGAYDDGRYDETCKKYLPEHKITAEYWIDELNDYDAFNDAGIWLYIATDQVKFKNEEGNVMDLVDVPKIVFSEIMRDVDLFVGVCSVGNDPEWQDNNGDRQEHRDYWQSYSFGDLTEIAKTRKAILERLLPRLKKIRGKAEIKGKFLIVKGDLRTYKIHIGSSNILMEPNDQYLCIVPGRSAGNTTDKLFIPFEGDKGLSIVLSKAFLLAEDKKITDTTITSQINRR